MAASLDTRQASDNKAGAQSDGAQYLRFSVAEERLAMSIGAVNLIIETPEIAAWLIRPTNQPG
ncbi:MULTISPECIES: hypothetical protein [Thiorhodovibrio]|uniref:hypothetical protein n=1 Tax=Thiorhodovibrio TaxID=61593 RepID=UPI001911879F|nr:MULTISPECIES: hypothetical protein [Thiorhodovibrio]MBK5969259.1 hypothetical protein [Thiorhodovibrio winogradskyi]WPL11250.1 hypothetical protein Thiosp_00982 [Thiorhodovibrio litoralis]